MNAKSRNLQKFCRIRYFVCIYCTHMMYHLAQTPRLILLLRKIHDNNDKACLLMVRYELPVFIMCSHMCMYVCIHVQYNAKKVNLCPVFMICLQIFNTGIISHTCSFNEIGGLKLHTAYCQFR